MAGGTPGAFAIAQHAAAVGRVRELCDPACFGLAQCSGSRQGNKNEEECPPPPLAAAPVVSRRAGRPRADGRGSSPAAAQGTPQQRAACEAEAQWLCSNYIPDVDAITACMVRNRHLLEPPLPGDVRRSRAPKRRTARRVDPALLTRSVGWRACSRNVLAACRLYALSCTRGRDGHGPAGRDGRVRGHRGPRGRRAGAGRARSAGVQRGRPARQGGVGGARAGARRAGGVGPRAAGAPHHRQSRARRPAEGRQPLRPADRARPDGGDRRDPVRCAVGLHGAGRTWPRRLDRRGRGRAAGGDRRQCAAAKA